MSLRPLLSVACWWVSRDASGALKGTGRHGPRVFGAAEGEVAHIECKRTLSLVRVSLPQKLESRRYQGSPDIASLLAIIRNTTSRESK